MQIIILGSSISSLTLGLNNLDLLIFRLTPQQIRVIDGCLGRTPKKFYEKVQKIHIEFLVFLPTYAFLTGIL